MPPEPSGVSYFRELRVNWRCIVASGLGQAAGYSVVNYVNNLFTPHLIEDFGWTRGDIANVGVLLFLGILAQPIAGRLTDAFGVRRVALVGVICAPVVWLALGGMTGGLWQLAVLVTIQVVLIGGTTSATIYSRLIAQDLDQARGIALAIAAVTPPAVAAASIPLLSSIIENHGWRAGYMALAAGTAVAGLIAISMIPRQAPASDSVADSSLAKRPLSHYVDIVKRPAFQLIMAGMLLCNLSFTLQTAQLKVVLLDHGVDAATGTFAVSLFAFSVIAGRLLCGIALDRFPAWLVSGIAMGLPGIGLGVLATGTADPMLVMPAILMLGFALGAEGDVLAYLVMRYFPLAIFSTALGTLLGGLAMAIALGSALLSLTLELSGGFTLFLVISSAAAFLGATLFFFLRRIRTED